jgi:SHS2 domain-containing protein
VAEDGSAPGWWHFEHGADIGVAGSGGTLAQAFEQTALALTAVVTDVPIECSETVAIHCQAPDNELLLVDWLNALIYAMAARRLLFGRFEVAIDGEDLNATAWGEPVDVSRHRPAVEIKGATYTALRVARQARGDWIAQTVLDV